MATEILTDVQGINEVRTHYIDFTNDLPEGVSISSLDGTHFPPSGSAGTPTFGTVSNNIAPVTIGPLTVTGRHRLQVYATLSDSEIITAQLIIPVEWDSARSGMYQIIQDLRLLAAAGSEEFFAAGIPMFTDQRVQDILDKYRQDHFRHPLYPVEQYEGGSVVYKSYYSELQNLEQTSGGTAVFWLESSAGSVVGSSLYSVDYRRGVVNFAQDTTGSVYFLYGRSYDLNRAAADVWRHKASYYGNRANFSTDNMRVEAGNLYKHALEMAESFEARAQTVSVTQLYRSDYAND